MFAQIRIRINGQEVTPWVSLRATGIVNAAQEAESYCDGYYAASHEEIDVLALAQQPNSTPLDAQRLHQVVRQMRQPIQQANSSAAKVADAVAPRLPSPRK